MPIEKLIVIYNLSVVDDEDVKEEAA